MGYCDIADIRAKMPLVTATQMSDVDVQDIITEVSNQIDANLAKRYALPLASPVPEILRLICKRLVCAEVLDVRQSGDTKADEVPLSVRITKHAAEVLEQLRTGKIVLPGAPFIANIVGTTSRPSGQSYLQNFDGRSDPDPTDSVNYPAASNGGWTWAF